MILVVDVCRLVIASIDALILHHVMQSVLTVHDHGCQWRQTSQIQGRRRYHFVGRYEEFMISPILDSWSFGANATTSSVVMVAAI